MRWIFMGRGKLMWQILDKAKNSISLYIYIYISILVNKMNLYVSRREF